MSDATHVIRLKPNQVKIFNSTKRFIVVNAGRRFGKSFVCGTIAERKIINYPNKTVIYVAPTQTMARNIMWKWFKKYMPKAYWEMAEKDGTKNEQLMTFSLPNGSEFYCMSADDPDRLRGLAADLLIADECADISNDFYDIVRPILSDKYHDGQAIFISTPKGYNWFYDMYHKGLEHPEAYDCFQFTTKDGGNVPDEEIEDAKRDMSPKMFAQEYLASFETLSGRVYGEYDRVYNECELDALWGMSGDVHIGMDFNVNPMTAAISVNEHGNTIFFDEIVENNSSTEEMAQRIEQKYRNCTVYVYPDPTGNKRQTNAKAGVTDFSILKKHGFIVCTPPHPYASKDKWNTVNSALHNSKDERHVFIASGTCPKLKKAWEGYIYKENGEPDKSSGLDHISDAAAYLICYKHPMGTNNRIRRPKILGV